MRHHGTFTKVVINQRITLRHQLFNVRRQRDSTPLERRNEPRKTLKNIRINKQKTRKTFRLFQLTDYPHGWRSHNVWDGKIDSFPEGGDLASSVFTKPLVKTKVGYVHHKKGIFVGPPKVFANRVGMCNNMADFVKGSAAWLCDWTPSRATTHPATAR